jgi:hypothetical protein
MVRQLFIFHAAKYQKFSNLSKTFGDSECSFTLLSKVYIFPGFALNCFEMQQESTRRFLKEWFCVIPGNISTIWKKG